MRWLDHLGSERLVDTPGLRVSSKVVEKSSSPAMPMGCHNNRALYIMIAWKTREELASEQCADRNGDGRG